MGKDMVDSLPVHSVFTLHEPQRPRTFAGISFYSWYVPSVPDRTHGPAPPGCVLAFLIGRMIQQFIVPVH
jgi:hypothetical protein